MKIFLGYGSEREAEARLVKEFVSSLGHDVWFDKDSIIAGQDWKRTREIAQTEADLIIHICAPEMFRRSGDVNSEIKKTLNLSENQPLGAIFSIFIKVENFHLPPELNRYQYILLDDDNWKIRLESAVSERMAQVSGNAPVLPKDESSKKVESGSFDTIKISDANEIYEILNEYISYNIDGLYWRHINSEIESNALDLHFKAKSNFLLLSKDETDFQKDRKYEQFSRTEEFFRIGEYLSLRIFNYYDFKGAHPNHFVKTLNFAGSDFGKLSIQDLMSNNEENARRVLKYCQKVVSAFHEGTLEEDFLESYAVGDDIWRLLGQFSYDEKGITFNFSPYDILPYVFGHQEAFVSWSFQDDKIDNKYNFLTEIHK